MQNLSPKSSKKVGRKLLAINGGKPVRAKKSYFPSASPIGKEEVAAVTRVVKSGALSKFIGCWGDQFFGGPEVQGLEKEWAKQFGATYAVSTNSATSSLIAALGAIGIEPGDEVIVSPYSMCISATAPLFWGAIPVFADIEPEYFTLDPKDVERKITPRTKAIIPVDLFGQPHDYDALRALAKKHNLKIISDSAQAPGALYKGKRVGSIADITIFSLNFHKHIHTGEGSVATTEDKDLALRMQLIRNHAEAVVGDLGLTNIVNMLGQNYRMTEYTAAIARSQLKKLKKFIKEYQDNNAYIAKRCQDMPGFRPCKIRQGCTSTHYMQTFSYDEKIVGVPREKFVEALRAELPGALGQEEEGTLISGGYVKPIYMEPIFQQRIAIGSKGYPWKGGAYTGEVKYEKGMCPVVEHWYEKEIITNDNMRHGMKKKDLDDVISAFHKVYKNRAELKGTHHDGE